MIDLISKNFDAQTTLAASSPEEFGANVLGVTQMRHNDLAVFIDEQPLETTGFIGMIEDELELLRSQQMLLELALKRMRPLIQESEEFEKGRHLAELTKTMVEGAGTHVPFKVWKACLS